MTCLLKRACVFPLPCLCLLVNPQSELEAELAEELASYGIDPGAQGLTDSQLAEAMAELERRRAGGLAQERKSSSLPLDCCEVPLTAHQHWS